MIKNLISRVNKKAIAVIIIAVLILIVSIICMKPTTDLSDSEKTLLSHTFSDDSSNVEKGTLDDEQKEVLDDVRLAEAYLSDRYGENFNFDMVNTEDGITKVTFSTSDSDELYTLEISNGVCRDNYYGVIIRQDYDEAVSSILKTKGIDCMVYTSFRQLADSSITVEDALKMGSELNRDTDIFVSEKVDKGTVKQVLEANNLYGSYELYSTKKIPKDEKSDTDSLEKLIRTGKLTSYDSFDTFVSE